MNPQNQFLAQLLRTSVVLLAAQKKHRAVLSGLILAACPLVLGQAVPPTILTIDIENFVQYQSDTFDLSQYGVNAGVTPPAAVLASHADFWYGVGLGDIVAVNGQPAKGLYTIYARDIAVSPNAMPGKAIADVQRDAIRPEVFEILNASGNPVGSIMVLGLSAGAAPPGSPASQTGVNSAVIGGTGAFVGVRGTSGSGGGGARTASVTEDPSNRRINGGSKARRIVTLFPMSAPQVIVTSNGPAVTHSSDFSLVTGSKPAMAGEILSVFMTGLGPVRPGVDPGQPFPSNPLATVNSPVAATVNGGPAEVLAAVGFPGAVDGYQVNFRLPSDTAKGIARVQFSAAWISAATVNIPVQ
jgi:hypothetical protein